MTRYSIINSWGGVYDTRSAFASRLTLEEVGGWDETLLRRKRFLAALVIGLLVEVRGGVRAFARRVLVGD